MVSEGRAAVKKYLFRGEGCAWTRPRHEVSDKTSKVGIGRCLAAMVPSREWWDNAKANVSVQHRKRHMLRCVWDRRDVQKWFLVQDAESI